MIVQIRARYLVRGMMHIRIPIVTLLVRVIYLLLRLYFNFVYRAKDVLFGYFLDWQNILDDLAILCILLIIPFRIADSDVQWVFAALTFMFHGLRTFKYAIMFK